MLSQPRIMLIKADRASGSSRTGVTSAYVSSSDSATLICQKNRNMMAAGHSLSIGTCLGVAVGMGCRHCGEHVGQLSVRVRSRHHIHQPVLLQQLRFQPLCTATSARVKVLNAGQAGHASQQRNLEMAVLLGAAHRPVLLQSLPYLIASSPGCDCAIGPFARHCRARRRSQA